MKTASSRTRRACVLSAVGLLSILGCGRQEPALVERAEKQQAEVTDITLGRGITPDRHVRTETESFLATDSIYASVATSGRSPQSIVQARWASADSQIIDVGSERVNPQQKGVAVFHLFRPDGLPRGRYRVEITIDGGKGDSKEFEVR